MDFNQIYVDINKTTVSEFKDSYDVVICNSQTGQGIVTNAINFEEFREYLKFDHGLDQTFYLKGTVVVELSATSAGIQNLIETPHANRNIKITNWKNSNKIQDPFTICVSVVDDTPKIYVASNGDNLEISNANLELNNSQLTFGYPINNNVDIVNKSVNDLTIINTKLQTNQSCNVSAHSFTFQNYNNVTIDYSILNVQTSSTGSLLIVNDLDVGTNLNILNSFVIRTSEFFDKIIVNNISENYSNLNVSNCVFSKSLEDLNGLLINYPDDYKVLNFNRLGNEFGWSALPSELDSHLYEAQQEWYYNYYDSNWNNSATEYSDKYNTHDYCHSPIRDGIGALTFPILEQFKIYCNPISGTVGDVVTVSAIAMLSSNNYFNNNKISSIECIVRSNGNIVNIVSATSSPSVQFVSNSIGNLNIELILNSLNGWYFKSNNIDYNVISSGVNYATQYNFDFDFDILCIKTNCSASNYVIASATTVSAFEPIVISAYNNCVTLNGNTNTPTIKSYYIDYENNLNYNFQNWFNQGNIYPTNFSYENSTLTEQHIYTCKSLRYVTMLVQFIDNSIKIKTKRLDIIDEMKNVYYVDISNDYEDSIWWEKESILIDYFDDGIQSYWNSDITTSASIKTVNNDKILSTNYDFTNYNLESNMTALKLFKNYIGNDFIFEFSIVRNDRNSIPKVTIFNEQLQNQFYVEWDYLNNKINFRFPQLVKSKSINYDLQALGFKKDLRCSNSLNTLYFKIVQTLENSPSFELYYKFRAADNWTYCNLIGYINAPVNLGLYLNSYTGVGYMKLQAKCGLPTITGTEEYPFSYKTFYNRISEKNINDFNISRGDYNDLYLLRGLRKISEFYMHDKFYNIDSWNALKYCNYVLVYDSDFMDMVLSNSTFSNGIIYNLYYDTYVNCKLLFSNFYNMFVTWNIDKISFNVWAVNNSKDTKIYEIVNSRYNLYGSTTRNVT